MYSPLLPSAGEKKDELFSGAAHLTHPTSPPHVSTSIQLADANTILHDAANAVTNISLRLMEVDRLNGQ